MQFTIHDNLMKKIGIMNNALPGSIKYSSENWHEYLAEGSSTFNFTVNKIINGHLHPNLNWFTFGNYISFYYNDEAQLFKMMHPIEDKTTIKVQCINLNLELINEQANAYTGTSLLFTEYMNAMDLLNFTRIQIGVNEVDTSKLSIIFDTQETKLARLLSLVDQFGAECEFITKLNSDGSFNTLILNVYKKNDGLLIQGVGKKRDDVILRVGQNITNITRDVDGTTLFNATQVRGTNGLTIKSTTLSIPTTDGTGREEFYIKSGESMMYAPLSMQLFPSAAKVDNLDQWTRRDFDTQYTTEADLVAYATAQLKKYAYPVITYTVDTAQGDIWTKYNLGIGDTIKVSDSKFDAVGLLLSVRIAERITCFSDPSQNTVVLSNFIQLKSKVSNQLQAMMQDMISAATPYTSVLTSTNGTFLKQVGDNTTLNISVYKGQDRTSEIIGDSYEWTLNNISYASTRQINISYSELSQSVNVLKVVVSLNGNILITNEVTIAILQEGSDGKDGISPINLVIESSNGYQFKNGIVNSTLTAKLYQENVEIDSDGTLFSYVWTKINSDGSIDSTWNVQHQAGSKSITITSNDLWQRATFNCLATSLN